VITRDTNNRGVPPGANYRRDDDGVDDDDDR
jgi:hypothetical protein